jgi:hypothetical protein
LHTRRESGRLLPSLATKQTKEDHHAVFVSRDTRRYAVPRGKAKFGATSPNSDLWPTDPVGAVTEIAKRHNATYIEGSLVFTPGGRAAEALFETVEPDSDDAPSQLFRLAEDLDAFEFQLFVDPDRWRFREGARQASGRR